MAREVDDDDDSLAPLGANTEAFLQDVKKGKPRNFMLICKGNKVRFLQVKKKAVKKSEIAEAKKTGYKGEVCVGVITGNGQNLVFNLATADGYTAEPCKEKSLKDFLADHADFKCHPTFAIVDLSPEVPFDDEDLQNPVIARYVGLGSLISTALEKSPNEATRIQTLRTGIRGLIDDENFNEATTQLNALEELLQSIISGQNQDTVGTPSTESQSGESNPPSQENRSNEGSSSTVDTTLRDKLIDTLSKLLPQIKLAITTDPNQKAKILDSVAEAKSLIKDERMIEARQAVLALAQFLKSINTPTGSKPSVSPSQTSDTPNDQLIAFRQRQSQLEPKYLEVLKSSPDKASSLSSVWAYAEEQASKQVFDKANQALDRLSTALDKLAVPKPETAPDSRLWADASRQARIQLRKFQLALRATRHPTAFQIIDLLDTLSERLEEIPASRSEAIELDRFIETDLTITSSEKPNPFGLAIDVRKPLRKALGDWMATLPN